MSSREKQVSVPVGIRAVRPLGIRPTWQIVMAPPLHNYVLGGVVSSNSHAVAYGEIAYRMAWLKAHYPAQFWAAFLSHEDDLDGTLGVCLSAARRQGVVVLPPDINLSLVSFVSMPGQLRCGLGVIRGIGRNLGEEIVRARQDGPFRSVSDFLRRVPAAGRRIPLTNLVLSGALDSFPGTRPEKLDCVAAFSGRGSSALAQAFQSHGERWGKVHLSPSGGCPGTGDWSIERKLDGEREATGDYLTGHPLALYRPVLLASGVVTLAEAGFGGNRSGESQMVAGIIRNTVHRKTKRGSMVVLTVDDETGTRTVTLSRTIRDSPDGMFQKGDRVVLRLDGVGGMGGEAENSSFAAGSSRRLASRLQASAMTGLDDYLSGLSGIDLLMGIGFSGWQSGGDGCRKVDESVNNLMAQYPGSTRLRMVFTDGVVREAMARCCRELFLRLRQVFPDAFPEVQGTSVKESLSSGEGLSPPALDGKSIGFPVRPFHFPGTHPCRG